MGLQVNTENPANHLTSVQLFHEVVFKQLSRCHLLTGSLKHTGQISPFMFEQLFSVSEDEFSQSQHNSANNLNV